MSTTKRISIKNDADARAYLDTRGFSFDHVETDADGDYTTCGATPAPYIETFTPPSERDYFHPNRHIVARRCSTCNEAKR